MYPKDLAPDNAPACWHPDPNALSRNSEAGDYRVAGHSRQMRRTPPSRTSAHGGAYAKHCHDVAIISFYLADVSRFNLWRAPAFRKQANRWRPKADPPACRFIARTGGEQDLPRSEVE